MYGASESQKAQSLFLAEMMGRLGYDVVNVGAPELTHGVDLLRETAKKSKFELVSSNLKRRSTGKHVFDPFVIRNIHGVRVAFLGVLSETEVLAPGSADGDDLEAVSAIESLRELLPRVRSQAHLVVLLAHVRQSATVQLVEAVDGIDVAISGGDPSPLQTPTVVGSDSTRQTLVLAAGHQGQYLGALSMVIGEHGGILRYDHKMHSLDANVETDSAITARVEKFKVRLREIKKREAVTDVVGSRQSQAETHRGPQEKFLGAQVCARCHEGAFQSWKDSPHAHSFASLESKAMENSAECLQCHVTGYKESSGYPNGDTELGSVSCEQCHGFGTLHGEKEFNNARGAQSCTVCHDRKNSPNFEYSAYWERIAH